MKSLDTSLLKFYHKLIRRGLKVEILEESARLRVDTWYITNRYSTCYLDIDKCHDPDYIGRRIEAITKLHMDKLVSVEKVHRASKVVKKLIKNHENCRLY